ncbi:CHASE3 domain-containing protein [uncultured Rhodoferax sp.]|uniref:CHASE3 domain-containing protein n=1 Tax=uncultured Rhodoferax sp. TaxID=223188 RepID=UPI0025F802DC|nr:CHASE3 domain-containing protein [uncultured Rhodoferax sp.]
MKALAIVRRHPVVLALACAAAAAMIFVSEGSYSQSIATLESLNAMGVARTQVQILERSMLDAETGQRGYLLTRRKEYLQPYEKALLRIDEAYRQLDQYYGADTESRALLKRLHELTDTKLSELALTLELFEKGKGQAGKEILLTDIGREKMDAVRAVSTELLAYQTQTVTARRAELFQTLMLGRIGVALLSALSLIGLIVYLRQLMALKLQQLEHQRAVQQERDRLEVEVMQRTDELTRLTRHLQTAREDERHRLARDLHDDLGSLLTSAKLDAARIRSRLSQAPAETLALLGHLVDTLNSGIALGRRIIEDLRPSSLSNLGLVAALDILVREYAERSGVQVHADLEPVQLSTTAELTVYRLVQEAITNITKYARASHVWVSLLGRDGMVEVTVRDDGVGFDASRQPVSAHGLVGMRFRVEAEGGTLRLVSAPGQGTRIQARIPESAPSQD